MRHFNILLICSTVICLYPFGSFAQEAQDEFYYYRLGQEAMQSGRWSRAVEHFSKADSLRANHPVIMQKLATACSMAGNEHCTFQFLEKIALINADESIPEDSVFQKWSGYNAFKQVKSFYKEMNRKVTRSDSAFIIPEKDLHPESIAYDPSDKSFYISSIRKRKIIKRNADGSFSPFASKNLYAASGMKTDLQNNALWVASPAASQMVGFTNDMKGNSLLARYDLDTGELMASYTVSDTLVHYFGDLIVHSNKNIYVTDSSYPAIYELKEGEDKLRVFKHFNNLRSLQGITYKPGEAALYFADYIEGLFKIDLKTGEQIKIEPLRELSLKGIDGLYYYKNSLLVIQNGVRPMRIARLFLDKKGEQIRNFEYLEKNNPILDEPTLGTIVDDTLYYVANSPWGKYDTEGNMLSLDKLDSGLIMMIPLKD